MSAVDLDAVRDRRAKAEAWYEGVHYGLKLYAASSDDVPALLEEVKRLRAELLAMADYAGEQANARRAAERVTAAAEAYRDAHPGGWSDVDLLGAVHNRLVDAVDEWRASRNGE